MRDARCAMRDAQSQKRNWKWHERTHGKRQNVCGFRLAAVLQVELFDLVVIDEVHGDVPARQIHALQCSVNECFREVGQSALPNMHSKTQKREHKDGAKAAQQSWSMSRLANHKVNTTKLADTCITHVCNSKRLRRSRLHDDGHSCHGVHAARRGTRDASEFRLSLGEGSK